MFTAGRMGIVCLQSCLSRHKICHAVEYGRLAVLELFWQDILQQKRENAERMRAVLTGIGYTMQLGIKNLQCWNCFGRHKIYHAVKQEMIAVLDCIGK